MRDRTLRSVGAPACPVCSRPLGVVFAHPRSLGEPRYDANGCFGSHLPVADSEHDGSNPPTHSGYSLQCGAEIPIIAFITEAPAVRQILAYLNKSISPPCISH